MWRILLVGPTDQPWSSIAAEVESDLARLDRPGVELSYRTTGRGPPSIRTSEDVEAAAPFVIDTVRDVSEAGFDAVIVDCTDDPGVVAARRVVTIPVIGAGEAVRVAAASSSEPVAVLSGDQLRVDDFEGLARQVQHARTVVLGGTGFSTIGDRLKDRFGGLVVLDPLAVALDACLSELRLRESGGGGPTCG